jgi:hypothetical protein
VIIVTARLCGPFAAWSSAWLQGRAAFDDVLAQAGVPGAVVVDHTRRGGLNSVGEVLVVWRLDGALGVRAAFPVAGDVRGVPGPSQFASAALDAGGAVFAAAVGLVPERLDPFVPGRLAPAGSSARELIRWHAYDVETGSKDHVQVEEAAHDLTESIRESASVLTSADVLGRTDDVREELSDARRAGERLSLPADYPQRAVLLLAQAERIAAVLDVAGTDPAGPAIDRRSIELRAQALGLLVTAVRRARVAGYNALDGTG